MKTFLDDYNKGKDDNRYLFQSLPNLDFPDKKFDLVLNSHCLFLYSEQLDLQFHLNSIKEMLRVGKKAKIYPLCELNGQESRHLQPVCQKLKDLGIEYVLKPTPYRFQKGADKFLELISI